jgi:hypothetical protein
LNHLEKKSARRVLAASINPSHSISIWKLSNIERKPSPGGRSIGKLPAGLHRSRYKNIWTALFKRLAAATESAIATAAVLKRNLSKEENE